MNRRQAKKIAFCTWSTESCGHTIGQEICAFNILARDNRRGKSKWGNSPDASYFDIFRRPGNFENGPSVEFDISKLILKEET